ncbi:unnamed protein product [Cylindrotheca closterium]|uniref:Galactokinase n=1 Tax=Cylindrotheca closterium TaxID=2856 RepID=A0AAD2FEZ4_9STRA|nr:unnamed protein product [Cylindrotheca closterium]
MSALDIPEIQKTHGAAMASKLEKASNLFQQHFSSSASGGGDDDDVTIAVAPGRVNLIGEHTDYTGGFVLPFAIEYSCVVYGQGKLTTSSSSSLSSPTQASLSFVSAQGSQELVQLQITSESTPPEKSSWTSYVCGTVFQYLVDLPQSSHLELKFAMASDVPLGSGLSSSASLEVSIARFVEAIIGTTFAFSSCEDDTNHAKIRAMRCQKAENTWCNSPCGIMDQYISSAATKGGLLMIDCTSLEAHQTLMASTERPLLVVANSNVQHDIGGGEYPIRVKQCQTATTALQKVNPQIQNLRDATLEDVEQAKEHMKDDVSYRRAKHVVTENARVEQTKAALEQGDWKQVGELMNQSHASMRDDYEVSCREIDMLVEIAQKQPGVYGSRLTGGGFGGCTVTLVDKSQAQNLVETLQKEYKAKTGKDCDPFQTQPAQGAHILTL